jgi:hypothetical protein
MTYPLQAVAVIPPSVYQTQNVLIFPTRWQLCIILIISRGTYSTAHTDLNQVIDNDGVLLNREDVRIVGIIK